MVWTKEQDQELFETLEKAIDATSLSYVLEQLAHVCEEKALHIESNWQDQALADIWANNGQKILEFTGKMDFA